MHYSQRTLLRIVTVFFLLVAAVFWGKAILQFLDRRAGSEDFLCATKTISTILPKGITVAGDIVIDFKTQRITLQYDVRQKNAKPGILYRDIYLKHLRRVADDVFTFEVASVKIFPTDTTGELFSYFRLLHPDASNELRLKRIGEKTYLFSLNRQIYNVCTAS